MSLRIILPILLALGLCISPAAQAGPPAKAPYVPHHTVISSVTADSITIDQKGGTKTYKITKNTEITFKGQTVTADQLQPGMRVSVTADAVDEGTAGQITANDPPKEAAPSPGK